MTYSSRDFMHWIHNNIWFMIVVRCYLQSSLSGCFHAWCVWSPRFCECSCMACFKFQVCPPMFLRLWAFDAKCLRSIKWIQTAGGLLGFTMVLWSASNEHAIVILWYGLETLKFMYRFELSNGWLGFGAVVQVRSALMIHTIYWCISDKV